MLKILASLALCMSPVVSAGRDYTPAELEIRNPPSASGKGLVVTYLGTTTALISDGETSLLTDGYFSRVKIDVTPQAGGLIEPNVPVIEAMLRSQAIDQLAAVMVVHSHFDHAMDAPIVAAKTGAELLGSESTANVGRGLKLPETQIRVVVPGEAMHYGKFTVRFYPSKHWPLPEPLASAMLGNSIDAPLVPPARFDAYKEGTSYTILLQHPLGNLLVQGSAGYLPGALAGVRADAILLGTGGLGDLPRSEQEAYYREIVTTTGARRLFPVHWDKLATPLTEPLVPSPDFQRSMGFLDEMQKKTGVSFAILPKGEKVLLEF